MNQNKQRVSSLLLAAVMALPLAALADDGEGAPPMRGDAGPPCGPEAGPGHAGPGMPGAHFDGMRGGPDGGPQGGGRPPFGPPPGPGMNDIELPFLHGVALNEAQQDKVFALLHAEAPYLRDQSKAAEKSQAALRGMSDGGAYDDAKAIAVAQAGAQARANIMLQHLRTQQKILALLTPEQRKQLADDQSRHQQRPQHP
jgi:protein CpxP